MPISPDALSDPAVSTGKSHAGPVRIVGWVDEVPRRRRNSPFDALVAELVELGDTSRVAMIEWEGKEITSNKVNQLRKQHPNCEWTQVTEGDRHVTYVRLKADAEQTSSAVA
jgi:hypothetical protein